MWELYKELFSKFKDDFIQSHFEKTWQQVLFYVFVFLILVVLLRIVGQLIFPGLWE